MKQLKKQMILLILALAAVAVLPAVANATQLKNEAGTPVPLGSNVSFKGFVTLHNSGFGEASCTEWQVNQKLTRNDGSTVEAAPGVSGPTSYCQMMPVSATITNLTWENFKAEPLLGASGGGTVKVSYTETRRYTCNYSGTVPFSFARGGSVLVFDRPPHSLTASTICGTEYFTGNFSILSSGGGRLKLE